MKNYYVTKFFLLVLFYLMIINYQVKSQVDEKAKPAWFTSKEVADNVWCISDHGSDNIYLVIGNEKALLIDTGIGVADLKSLIKTITNLPIVVVNTHAHPDHCGGNFQFDEIFINQNDFELADYFCAKEQIESTAKSVAESNAEIAKCIFSNYDNYKKAPLVPVEEGNVFDLGGRKLEVIWVPGHTMGSVCLIDKENKQLFTGDNNNTHVWLFLDGCPPVEKYLESLNHLKTYNDNFDTIFLGHGEPMGNDYLDEIRTCVENILNGKCEASPYTNQISNKAMKCVYKRALVAFDPKNLLVKK